MWVKEEKDLTIKEFGIFAKTQQALWIVNYV